MKKSDLKNLLGEDIGNWEIVNVGYETMNKQIDLLLTEYEWKGVFHGRDYKDYTSNVKKLKILDEYAFKYYEDNNFVNAVEEYVKYAKGLDINQLDVLIKNPFSIATTEVQTEWKEILLRLGLLDIEEYNKKFLEEFKSQLDIFYTKNPEHKDIFNYIKFFEEISLTLQQQKI